MIYRILAELVVLLHFIFILFNLLGGFLVLWRKWLVFIHIPSAIWGSFIVILGGTCPLTPLEKTLRIAGGEESYSGGFILHYLIPLIYPQGLTREMQITLGYIAIVINILVYIYVVYRYRRKKPAANN